MIVAMEQTMIYPLDLDYQGLPQAIAAYLIKTPAGNVLVETGPGSTLPVLLAQLAVHGLVAADIRHVLVTHIHLDHAGAAGWWGQQGATIYVHYLGAPHLIDPSKLLSSASRIYGDQMERLWGQTLPVPAGQIVPLRDQDVLTICGLQFKAIETAGHAWHHHAFALGDVVFTGDAAGVQLPGQPWTALPAPPPEFNLESWLKSLDKLQNLRAVAFYLTHFGRIDKPEQHINQFRKTMLSLVEFVRTGLNDGLPLEQLTQRYIDHNRQLALQAGVSEEIFSHYEAANPVSMSVTGIARYWQKRLT